MVEKFGGKWCEKIVRNSLVGKLGESSGWKNVVENSVEKVVGKIRLNNQVDKFGGKVLLKNCIEQLNWPFGGKLLWPVWCKNVMGKLVGTIRCTNLV